MLDLEISSESTLLLVEVSVEKRDLLKAPLSESHSASMAQGSDPPLSLGLWKAPSVVRTTTFFSSSWGVGENICDGSTRRWSE